MRRGSSLAERAAGCGEQPRFQTSTSPASGRSDAFLAASRDGDFGALLEVLDLDVVVRADWGAVGAGASREVRGARAVAEQAPAFSRLGLLMRPALVNGAAGAVSTRDGEPFSVGGFTVRGGKIVAIDILADLARLRKLDLVAVLDD